MGPNDSCWGKIEDIETGEKIEAWEKLKNEVGDVLARSFAGFGQISWASHFPHFILYTMTPLWWSFPRASALLLFHSGGNTTHVQFVHYSNLIKEESITEQDAYTVDGGPEEDQE